MEIFLAKKTAPVLFSHTNGLAFLHIVRKGIFLNYERETV